MFCLIKICKRLRDHKRQEKVYVNCDYALVRREAGAFSRSNGELGKAAVPQAEQSPSFTPPFVQPLLQAGFGRGRFAASLAQTPSLPALTADSSARGGSQGCNPSDIRRPGTGPGEAEVTDRFLNGPFISFWKMVSD